METITPNDSGAAVEDVQQRLVTLNLLDESQVSGVYDAATIAAVEAFRANNDFAAGEDVTEKVWSALVDATYSMGDRTLYLRMPYFHGNDVRQLQHALAALGFGCGSDDGIFGAFTELALRKFQLNMGLPSDGIAGAYTYAALRNLRHSWEGKEDVPTTNHLGFARAADVLETNALCLFGTTEFTRAVASRMSNLALATNPTSKIMSAESLLVAPDDAMLLVHIVLPDSAQPQGPLVAFEDEASLALRLQSAIEVAKRQTPSRIAIELPGESWLMAGADRSAQHYAIALLDALCVALSTSKERK